MSEYVYAHIGWGAEPKEGALTEEFPFKTEEEKEAFLYGLSVGNGGWEGIEPCDRPSVYQQGKWIPLLPKTQRFRFVLDAVVEAEDSDQAEQALVASLDAISDAGAIVGIVVGDLVGPVED